MNTAAQNGLEKTDSPPPPEVSPYPVGSAAARLTSSTYVQITLLLLYSLPLFMLVSSAIASRGFLVEHKLLLVTLDVIPQYAKTLRDAFGTLVIPFVTALSAGRWSESTKGGMTPIHMFSALVFLLVLAILLQAYMNVRGNNIVLNTSATQEQVDAAKDIIATYVKEALTYISLLLGVSLWRRG